MDPCPFLRIIVGNIALRKSNTSPKPQSPSPSPSPSGIHPSPSPCFCKIRINKLPYQTSEVTLHHSSEDHNNSTGGTLAAVFDIAKPDLEKLSAKPLLLPARKPQLKIAVYSGTLSPSCSLKYGRLLGKLSIPLDVKTIQDDRPCIFHSGWLPLRNADAELHFTAHSEPDPRFVFEFGGEPECSPQVFQVQGSMRQPVFTCKFAVRSQSERCPSSLGSRRWLGAFGSGRERLGKERKGWTVTVHDLSGSPVAMASMVTPFVASPGSDRVSRASPGAWLVLRPGDNTWKPWGRLEAWRARAGITDALGYRLELLPDANMTGSAVHLAELTLSAHSGGKFVVDQTGNGSPLPKLGRTGSQSVSPGCSPRCLSGRLSYSPWPFQSYKGFVMSSTVEGEGRCSKPRVEMGAQNVRCSEDAAAFIALAAAVDLSMDACRLFSQKLRRELSQQHRDALV